MPIQPEPATSLLIIAATALIVCFLLYLVHRYWRHFAITSIDDLEQAHAPFDNYCALLDIAERFQHIADIAAQRATICKTAAEQMQRENGRQWKARHRGAPITDHINKLLTRSSKDESLDQFRREFQAQPKTQNTNGTHKPKPIVPAAIAPRTHRACCVCNKPFLTTDPIRMDDATGDVYHDGTCAIDYIERKSIPSMPLDPNKLKR